MITKQEEQERNSHICHSNPVNKEKHGLKLKNLKGMVFQLYYRYLLRYGGGWWYIEITPLYPTNIEKGGVSKGNECYH